MMRHLYIGATELKKKREEKKGEGGEKKSSKFLITTSRHVTSGYKVLFRRKKKIKTRELAELRK